MSGLLCSARRKPKRNGSFGNSGDTPWRARPKGAQIGEPRAKRRPAGRSAALGYRARVVQALEGRNRNTRILSDAWLPGESQAVAHRRVLIVPFQGVVHRPPKSQGVALGSLIGGPSGRKNDNGWFPCDRIGNCQSPDWGIRLTQVTPTCCVFCLVVLGLPWRLHRRGLDGSPRPAEAGERTVCRGARRFGG